MEVERRSEICKHWKRKGVCSFGEKCLFQHPIELQKQIQPQSSMNDQPAEKLKRFQKRRENRKSKIQSKAMLVRKFILDLFGRDLLKSGSGVLEIAGGSSELAIQLINLNKIACTVVDPRRLKVEKFKKRLELGFYHKNSIFQNYNDVSQSEATIRLIDPIPEMWLSNEIERQGHYEKSLEMSKQAAWTRKGLKIEDREWRDSDCENDDSENEETEKHELNNEIKQTQQEQSYLSNEQKKDETIEENETLLISDFGNLNFEDENSFKSKPSNRHQKKKEQRREKSAKMKEYYSELERKQERPVYDIPLLDKKNELLKQEQKDLSWKEANQIFSNCSVVVGIHPDQATEAIVDFALYSNKPFVVIPCCVYQKEFPKRKMPDGTSVSNYDLLIQYLLLKNKNIKTVKIEDMAGPNQVLFWIPNQEK